MTARELGLLGILGFQNVADAVEKFLVTLLGVLIQSSDESVGHGACGLRCDSSIRARELLAEVFELVSPLTMSGHLCFQTT